MASSRSSFVTRFATARRTVPTMASACCWWNPASPRRAASCCVSNRGTSDAMDTPVYCPDDASAARAPFRALIMP